MTMTDKLRFILETTGNLTPEQKQEILFEHMLEKLTDIESKVDSLLNRENEWEEKLQNLAKNSLLLIAKQNPKAAGIILVILMILLNLWFVSDFRMEVLQWLGLPGGLLIP